MMSLVGCKLAISILLAYVLTNRAAYSKHLPRDTQSGGVKLSGREPCSQKEPYKWFRNTQGTCSICTECHRSGLKERRSCTNYRDAKCRNVCINRDARYNPVIGACEQLKHQLISTTTVMPTTHESSVLSSSSTPVDLREHPTPKSLSSKSEPGSSSSDSHTIYISAATVSGAVVLVLVGVIFFLQRKRFTTREEYNPVSAPGQMQEIRISDSVVAAGIKNKGDPNSKLEDPDVRPAYNSKNNDMRFPCTGPENHIYEEIKTTTV